MSERVPGAVKRAASSFHRQRAEYYDYLARILTATAGNTKLLTLFERDAERYPGEPRGVLAAYWADTFAANGSDLAATWQGTLPDDEVSIIRVAQSAGGGALETALQDVARVAQLADKIKREVGWTLAAGLVALALATAMWTAFPLVVASKFQELYGFIPMEAWGPKGKRLMAYTEGVRSYGLLVAGGFAMLLAWVQWSINNWVGPARDWADSRVVLWRAIRDVKGALFLATMATLTRKRGNVTYTLQQSLEVFSASLRSAWLRWRVEEIMDRVDQTGGTNSDLFQTNLISREMFFFLRDTQEARGFSEGFQETGLHVENKLVGSIITRMQVYRWAMLFASLMLVLVMVGSTFSVINEMRGVMQNYYSSR